MRLPMNTNENERVTRVHSQELIRGAEGRQLQKAAILYRQEKLLYAVYVQQRNEGAERGKNDSRRESEMRQ